MPLPDDGFSISGGCCCHAVRYRIYVPTKDARDRHHSVPTDLGGHEDGATRIPFVCVDHCDDCRAATGAVLPMWICSPSPLVEFDCQPKPAGKEEPLVPEGRLAGCEQMPVPAAVRASAGGPPTFSGPLTSHPPMPGFFPSPSSHSSAAAAAAAGTFPRPDTSSTTPSSRPRTHSSGGSGARRHKRPGGPPGGGALSDLTLQSLRSLEVDDDVDDDVDADGDSHDTATADTSVQSSEAAAPGPAPGAAPGTRRPAAAAAAAAATLPLLRGDVAAHGTYLRFYRVRDGGGVRSFCGRCGTSLTFVRAYRRTTAAAAAAARRARVASPSRGPAGTEGAGGGGVGDDDGDDGDGDGRGVLERARGLRKKMSMARILRSIREGEAEGSGPEEVGPRAGPKVLTPPVPPPAPALSEPQIIWMVHVLLGTVDRRFLGPDLLVPERQVWWDSGIRWVKKLASRLAGPKHPGLDLMEMLAGRSSPELGAGAGTWGV